jgi:hypothetical protein
LAVAYAAASAKKDVTADLKAQEREALIRANLPAGRAVADLAALAKAVGGISSSEAEKCGFQNRTVLVAESKGLVRINRRGVIVV